MPVPAGAAEAGVTVRDLTKPDAKVFVSVADAIGAWSPRVYG
jgi:hypothetical protein